ncbi:MAG: signal peptidase I [Lachnospiraceae bacterium]|nr:signal peptidase I [Lachnospiraceae bacterium]
MSEKKSSKKSTIVVVIMLALILILCGAAIYLVVQSAKGNAVLINKRGVMHVITGSMEPTLHVDDFILIKKVPKEELQEGDIITFKSKEEDAKNFPVTHRIVNVNSDGTFTTRGDANPTDDKLAVSYDQVYGKYQRKSKVFTWLATFGDFRKVLMLFIMLCITAMALHETRTIMMLGKEVKDEKKELSYEERMREAIEKEKERLREEELKGKDIKAEGIFDKKNAVETEGVLDDKNAVENANANEKENEKAGKEDS